MQRRPRELLGRQLEPGVASKEYSFERSKTNVPLLTVLFRRLNKDIEALAGKRDA